MVIYNPNSKEKVFHLPNCHYIRRIKAGNRKQFAFSREAYKAGYRPCSHCIRLKKQMVMEKGIISKICFKEGISCTMDHGFISVMTHKSAWRIFAGDLKKSMILYHANAWEKHFGTVSKDPFEGYHWQGVSRKSLQEYLEYILRHDRYRYNQPYTQIDSEKKPRKGTKRWKAQQKKKKRYEKYLAVRHVYALLENI